LLIIVGGGSGFIGRTLCQALQARGDKVIILSRQSGPDRLTWTDLKRDGLPPCDGVINLAGSNVMAKRWSESYKRELFASRIDTAQAVATAVRSATNPPALFLNASAIAYYPSSRDQLFDESGPPGADFLSRLTQAWEKASELSGNCPTRRALLRIGVVLGKGGGALQKMLPPFKLGLGGPVGSGNQPFPWIHIDDLVGIMLYILDNETVLGPVNAMAPVRVTMGQFTTALGKAMRKPARLKMPAALLKLLLGERATVLLQSPQAEPKKITAAGYEFRYPILESALPTLL
jgi:uncharacterized protein (TIGR01777 family)